MESILRGDSETKTRIPIGSFPGSSHSPAGNDSGSQSSRVFLRLTREGMHFVFVTTFILIGAIIRDVNLLVILAGILVTMLLLQTRLAKSTLQNLSTSRSFPRIVHARESFCVELRIDNRKRWLGAWGVIVRDQVCRISGKNGEWKEGWSTSDVASEIIPGGTASLRYRCRLMHRGEYRLGPLQWSTLFPMGLVKASASHSQFESCVVLPAIGQISPSWRSLFRTRRIGGRPVRAQSSAGDGEFYGLRDYRAGDSPRWIHWRTSARRSDLMVRQFERQDGIDACLCLDLFRSPTESNPGVSNREGIEESAIEFVATLLRFFVARNLGALSLSVAAEKNGHFGDVRSFLQLETVLKFLATVHPTSDADAWQKSLRFAATQMRRGAMMLVISTRSNPWESNLPEERKSHSSDSPHGRDPSAALDLPLRWIDMRSPDWTPFFQRASL